MGKAGEQNPGKLGLNRGVNGTKICRGGTARMLLVPPPGAATSSPTSADSAPPRAHFSYLCPCQLNPRPFSAANKRKKGWKTTPGIFIRASKGVSSFPGIPGAAPGSAGQGDSDPGEGFSFPRLIIECVPASQRVLLEVNWVKKWEFWLFQPFSGKA